MHNRRINGKDRCQIFFLVFENKQPKHLFFCLLHLTDQVNILHERSSRNV